MPRLRLVGPNYNYGKFIGSAIRSALAVEWPDVEVIVVDNGSTDSHSVISSFGSRITGIFQENAGPRVACNAGLAGSTGDAVIFPGLRRCTRSVDCPKNRHRLASGSQHRVGESKF